MQYEDQGKFYRGFSYFWFGLALLWLVLGFYHLSYSTDTQDLAILNFAIAAIDIVIGLLSLNIAKKRNEAYRNNVDTKNGTLSSNKEYNDNTSDIEREKDR